MTNAVLDPPSNGQPLPHDDAARQPVVHIRRFDRQARLMHIVTMVTFLGLSATGLPLKPRPGPRPKL